MGFLSNLLNSQRPDNEDDVAQIRSRARRRLIGAAMLLAVGVIGFPLLFETQPRPVPMEVPTVIPRKDLGADATSPTKIADKSTSVGAAASKPMPSASLPEVALPAGAIVEKASEAGRDVSSKGAAVAAAAAAAAVVSANTGAAKAPAVDASRPKAASSPSAAALPPVPKSESRVVTVKPDASTKTAKAPTSPASPKPSTAEAPARSDKTVAAAKPAKPEAKPTAPAKAAVVAAANTGPRFVVQFGAFTQDAGVRAVQSRLERAGLKSYTQVVNGEGGKRTRVRAGPYNSREEAERAAEQAKTLGLTASVAPLD